jgi:2-phosphosulfolactate phosphatase
VHGRRVLITTTNGTHALHRARLADRVVVGALVNLSAVAASIEDEPRVAILCAGTDGCETGEDVLAAGAIVDKVVCSSAENWQLDAAAQRARREWTGAVERARAAGRSVAEQLAVEFRDTPGGRNLVAIGLDRDLIDCAQIDRLNVVPELDVGAWRISLSSPQNAPR